MPNKPTSEQLEADNQDLRARLEKSEATLSEILGGEADALFVTGVAGAQLFTLKGVDQSYRTLIENMSEGALTLTPEGLVLYANRRFAEMLGAPLEKVIGSEIRNWFVPENRQALQALLQKDALDSHREELALAAADGTLVPVYLSVSRLVLDEIDSICMVVTDLTEQKRNEAILAAEKLSNAILEQAADAIVICDESGRIMRASTQAHTFCSKSPLGQLFEQAFPLRQLDGAAFSAVRAIDTNRQISVEARLKRNGREFDLLVSVGHLKGARDELLGSVVTLTDITERKTAELALKKSERQLSEALAIARIGYWEYEFSTDEFIFNDQYYSLHKITAEEAGGYRMSSADFASRYVYPEDAPIVGQQVRLAFETHDPDYFAKTETRILSGEGEVIWVEVRFRVEKDLQGNTIRLIGVNQDVTERKLAEMKLIESERRFTDLLENVELISMMLDREARITYCNDYLLRLTGWQREEAIGKNWWDLFVPPELHDLKGDFFAALLENRPEALHHENDIVTRSGERRLIRWNNSVLRSGAGEVIGTASIGEDITDRILAEKDLRWRTAFFEALVKTSVDGILVVDSQGNNILQNQRMIDLWEIPEDLAANPDDKSRLQYIMNYVVDAKQFGDKIRFLYDHPEETSQDEVALKNGTVLDRYSAPVFDSNRNYFGRIWSFHDITERKRNELKLLESERRFTDMLGNVELISVMRDREERITYCNEYLLRLTGWRYEEVIGRNWAEIFLPPEIVEEKKKFFAELLLNSPEARHHESEILTRSREHRLVRWNNMLLRSEDGNVIGTASIGEDITHRRLAELERQHREAELAESQRISRIGSWEWNLATSAILWSEGLNLVLARDIGSPAPMFDDLQQFYTPESWQRLSAAIARTIDTGAPYDLELEMINANGAACWTSTHGEAVLGTDGAMVMLRGTVQDISERKKSEASIKYLNRVLSMLSGINSLIVRVNNREDLFRDACNIAVGEGGFRMAMIVIVDRSTMLPVLVTSSGKPKELLVAVENAMSSGEVMQKSLVGRVIREKKAVISNDARNDPRLIFGKQYAEAGVNSMTVLPLIVSGEGVGVLALYASEMEFFQKDEMRLLTELAGDISFAMDHITQQERLKYLAYYDVLTGLANRSLFFDRVAQYIHSANSGGHKLGIVLIDLERFKNINDSLGRPAGDSLLKQVAEWLAQLGRDPNLLARIEADHFAFVVPEVKLDDDMTMLIENLIASFLEHSFSLNEAVFRFGIKVGVALYPDDGYDADTLVRNAEVALKKAKVSGVRFLFYKRIMNEAALDRFAIENQLRRAIDNEEFVLHYQPKVNLVSGKVTSAEALIRWNEPRTGLMPPGMFIPILEECGLINEVGRWALRKAMTDYLRWRAAGLAAVRIAVNVSPLQLRNINFMDEVRQVVALHADVAEGLELEITESVIMEDVKHSITSLQAIRAMGVTIAIDDFGTGFSSLNYLAKLPVDTLKIDRSFVIEMDAPEGLALVSTIILVAHALKLKVVAEGVETEKQSRQLLSLNCDEMQGFLFSKPVPVEIFEAKFLAHLLQNETQ